MSHGGGTPALSRQSCQLAAKVCRLSPPRHRLFLGNRPRKGYFLGGGVPMKLLMIRHAIAEEREDFARTGKDDHLRPLTDEGRKKMKQNARGLKKLVHEIDLLATSPLTRAAQTGAILDSVFGGLSEVEVEQLSPDAEPREFLRWLRKQKGGCVAVVGHEPSLSLILSSLLTGGERRLFAF